jgi:hypothetical protein
VGFDTQLQLLEAGPVSSRKSQASFSCQT